MGLENKNAIIYGAGGSIGGAVAARFARDGARVFLVGRTQETLDQVAKSVAEAGGQAEVAVLDALDEQAVDDHVRSVAAQAGSVDISFNLINRGDIQGVPLIDLSVADYAQAIVNGVSTNFITARAAARQMTGQGSGVILALNSGSSHGSPMMGNTGPLDAAIDVFVRNLAMEVGPNGVRVLGIWTAGLPETFTLEKLQAVNAQFDEAAFQGMIANLDQMRMTRKSPTLEQIAATAAFLVSDGAAAITGTWINATSGIFPS